jgi:hypothetical protein
VPNSDTVEIGTGAGPAQLQARPPKADGVRLVTRENGRYVDLMPSPSSSYLLPTLADCSLVRREAPTPIGSLRFYGGVIEVEETAEGWDFGRLGAQVSTENLSSVVVGSIGVWMASLLHGFGGLSSSFTRAVTSPEAIQATLMPPESVGLALVPPVVMPQLFTAPSATAAPPEPLATPKLDTSPTATENSLPEDAPVADVASRIAALSGLNDELLAELFKVERETFCRWRTGALANPRVGNRRRLGLLLMLLDDLAERQVTAKDWLLNHVTPQGLTPYQLLERGQIDEVAFLAASLGESPLDRDARVADRAEPEPLVFGDDDAWDLEPPDDGDDQ